MSRVEALRRSDRRLRLEQTHRECRLQGGPFRSLTELERGYAVVETDNPASVAEGSSKFGASFEFEVTPRPTEPARGTG